MRKIGFDAKNEFLPSFDKFKSNANQRLMFMKFFNQDVCSNIRFSKYELLSCQTETLFSIFIKKIKNNIRRDSYISSRIVKIDDEKSNKINNFSKKIMNKSVLNNFSILNTLFEPDISVAVKLIDVLENCKINFSDGILRISGHTYHDGDWEYISDKKYYKEINVGVNLNENIKATCENGLFKITILKNDLNIDSNIEIN